MNPAAEFDRHADSYDTDLERALSIGGEGKDYYARRRVDWLAAHLQHRNYTCRKAIDFGCGIGDTTLLLRESLEITSIFGLDVSVRSLELAHRRYASSVCKFFTFDQYSPQEDADLVYCNGVFHHIPLAERNSAVDFIFRSLRPGGFFAFWENNPWNIGTRYVMSRCVFDGDAIPLAPPEAARLVMRRGFQVVERSFLFFFPKLLSFCRPMERHLSGVPLGAQYMLLCRKPETTTGPATTCLSNSSG
jgi:SAM-dependent methyltransferase